MTRAGAFPTSILPSSASPGPGAYNLDNRPKTTGTIPFMGRGKMETDILVASAKLMPGPGYYDLPSNPPRGGKIPAARVPSGIESLLRIKSTLPGPGYYDLDDSRPPMRLAHISKSRGVNLDRMKGKFEKLFETFS